VLIYILITTFLGGLIGWSTNILAVKLIFRPYNPYKLLGLFTIQGLIPKRKSELALAIGQTVENELLSSAEVLSHLHTPSLQSRITVEVIENIKLRAEGILPSFIPSSIKEYFVNKIDEVIEGEVVYFIDEAFPKLSEEIKDSLPIASMIEGKINQLDLKELEEMVLKIAQKELKHIEYLGGILGLIIGLTQGIILIMLTS